MSIRTVKRFRRIGATGIGAAVLMMHLAVMPALAEDSALSNLNHLLEAELSRWPAHTGLYVKHLGTGEQARIRAQERFESASTIKVAIMVRAFQLADENKLDLTSRHELTAGDYRGGSGILKYSDLGLKLTLHDMITQMIITSDNTATDIMVAKVGGREKLNEFLREAGYKALKLNRTTHEFFRQSLEAIDPKFGRLSPEQVFAIGADRPAFTEPYRDLIAQVKTAEERAGESRARHNDDETKWFGVATPAEMGALLEGIERCTLATRQSCEDMKRILRAQQVTHKIPHYLSVPAGNKTGDTGSVTNDVGIIYSLSGPIVMASYNMDIKGQRTELDDCIGALARRVVDYFDGGPKQAR